MSTFAKTNLFLILIFSGSVLFGQNFMGGHNSFVAADKKQRLNVRVSKSGPYIGWQRGKYDVIELGVQQEWKKIELLTAHTYALNAGCNYNFFENVLGFDAGMWIKPTRVGFTYGASAVYRTDFTHNRIGIAPVIGYRLFFFHLQAGAHLLTPSENFKNTNFFFISLRVVIINNRDVKFKKGNEPLFKKKKAD